MELGNPFIRLSKTLINSREVNVDEGIEAKYR